MKEHSLEKIMSKNLVLEVTYFKRSLLVNFDLN